MTQQPSPAANSTADNEASSTFRSAALEGMFAACEVLRLNKSLKKEKYPDQTWTHLGLQGLTDNRNKFMNRTENSHSEADGLDQRSFHTGSEFASRVIGQIWKPIEVYEAVQRKSEETSLAER